jgi:hypothetical protein
MLLEIWNWLQMAGRRITCRVMTPTLHRLLDRPLALHDRAAERVAAALVRGSVMNLHFEEGLRQQRGVGADGIALSRRKQGFESPRERQ